MKELRQGRYVCHATLGEGGQGTTYDAVDRRDGRPVAVKCFQVRGAKSWKDVELAEREARVLSSLHHPKLPEYVDHFEEDGALYLVMGRIEGESLSALRKRGASLGEDDVVRLLRDASEVLDYLHGRAPPVIHRDLKPGNVIRRPDGSYAFVDFGAVRDRLRPEGGSTVVGTFGYMAPEQFQGRASPASDVYSIAATALTLLTGEEPETLPHKGLAIDVDAALRGRASKSLAAALARMLEPDPDVRPQRLAPLLEGLDEREGSRASAKRGAEHSADRRTRRAERHAERQRARAERQARRGHGPGLPWPVLVLVQIALTLATVGVVIALRVLVPTVLTILSLFLGRSLRESAGRVSEAGRRAGEGLERARAIVNRSLAPAPEREAPLAEAPTERARVRVPDGAARAADDERALAKTELARAEEEAAEEEARIEDAKRSER